MPHSMMVEMMLLTYKQQLEKREQGMCRPNALESSMGEVDSDLWAGTRPVHPGGALRHGSPHCAHTSAMLARENTCLLIRVDMAFRCASRSSGGGCTCDPEGEDGLGVANKEEETGSRPLFAPSP